MKIQNSGKKLWLNGAPVMERLYDDRAVLRPECLTVWPHTDLYFSGDFILMCFYNTVKTKENQLLSLSRKIRPCWKNSCTTNCLI